MDIIAEAIYRAKWSERVEQRRLEILRLHFDDGVPILRLSQLLANTEFAVTQRQIWRDWAAVRKLMRESLTAPQIEEIRERCKARYDYLYRLALDAKDIGAAIRANDRMAQICGVMDSPQATNTNVVFKVEWPKPIGAPGEEKDDAK